jgi:hypothetical protein
MRQAPAETDQMMVTQFMSDRLCGVRLASADTVAFVQAAKSTWRMTGDHVFFVDGIQHED